jgi:hypothetical protein
MTNPTHIVECEGPESQGFKTQHPRLSFHYSYVAAEAYIRSKVALSADIPLKHKHIWGIRKVGSDAGDWLHRTAG